MSPKSAPGGDAAEPLDGFEVLDAFHRKTFERLDELAALVAGLGDDPPGAEQRAAAAGIVAFFSAASRQHHDDEEQHVFPPLLAGADEEVARVVKRLVQDHRWLHEGWRELEPQLDAIASGQAWVDLDTLREATTIFVALSRDHVALEESLIYPEARVRLGERAKREMGREMAARRRARRAAG